MHSDMRYIEDCLNAVAEVLRLDYRFATNGSLMEIDSTLRVILNQIFDYSLVPAQNTDRDAFGIDLVDSQNAVAVHVLANSSRQKIIDALDLFGHSGQDEKYWVLILLIASDEPIPPRLPHSLNLDLQVINMPHLLDLIRRLPAKKQKSISDYLRSTFIPEYDLDFNLSSIEYRTDSALDSAAASPLKKLFDTHQWVHDPEKSLGQPWESDDEAVPPDLTGQRLKTVRFACLLSLGGVPWELFRQCLPESCRDELAALVEDGYLYHQNGMVFMSPTLHPLLLDQVRPTKENCSEFLDRLLLFDRTRFWQRLHFLRRREVLLQLARTFGQAAHCIYDPDGALALHCAAFYARINETSTELQWSLRAARACESAPTRNVWSLGNAYLRTADCYQRLGDNVNALLYCKKALSLCEEGLRLSAPDLARVHYQTGLAHAGLGNHSAALKSLKKALDYSVESLAQNHPLHNNIYNMLSISNRASGNIIEARESKLQSVRGAAHTWSPTQSKELVAKLAQLEKVQGWPGLFQGNKNEILCFEIGDLYHSQGDYPMALDYHMQALELREKRSEAAPKDLADSYHRIGMIFRDLDDHNEAIQYLQEAERIRTHSTGIPEADLVCTYLGLGSVYSDCGMYQYALENLTNGLALQKKLLHPHAPELADTYTALGSICRALGKDQDAQKHYSMAVNIRQVTLPETHPDLAGAYMNSANARVQLSQHRLALRDAQRALDIYQTIYPAGHPQRITAQQTVSWLEELTANS